MMRAHIFCMFIVIQAISGEDLLEADKMITITISGKCKNITCTNEEDPRCVHFKHQKDTNKTLYVIAINKCEVQLMNCHKAYIAKMVPMKYCGHENLTSNVNETHHTRVKRHINTKDKLSKRRAFEATKWPSKTIRAKKHEHQKSPKNLRIVVSNELNESAEGQNKDPEELASIEQKRFFEFTDTDDAFSEFSELSEFTEEFSTSLENTSYYGKIHIADESEESEDAGSPDKSEAVDQESNVEVSDSEHTEDEDLISVYMKKITTIALVPEETFEEDERGPQKLKAVERETEFPIISSETLKEIKDKESITALKYEEETILECPERCPARGMMVCAVCKHGVYRTFMSACHMQMYTCRFRGEDLTLISRYPCVLSAPFSDNKGMSVRARIVQERDQDSVLRFIKCKSQGKLNKDPRCDF